MVAVLVFTELERFAFEGRFAFEVFEPIVTG